MVIFVIVCNVLIGLVCLGVAWQFWQLKDTLAGVTAALLGVEKAVYDVLHPAPENILKGQTGVRQARLSYRNLAPQLQRLEQVLGLLSVGRMVWRRSPWHRTRAFRRSAPTRR